MEVALFHEAKNQIPIAERGWRQSLLLVCQSQSYWLLKKHILSCRNLKSLTSKTLFVKKYLLFSNQSFNFLLISFSFFFLSFNNSRPWSLHIHNLQVLQSLCRLVSKPGFLCLWKQLPIIRRTGLCFQWTNLQKCVLAKTGNLQNTWKLYQLSPWKLYRYLNE